MHPTHLPPRSAPKGFGQELKELWETLVGLPSVIRQIVRSLLLVSKYTVTCISSVGSNSCAFYHLQLISGPHVG